MLKATVFHIFTPEGHTYTFKDVQLVSDNEAALGFTYTAQSDGKRKSAVFQKSKICGWSFLEEPA